MKGHPETELAAYASGDITAEERERVERHLVDCAECRATVADFGAVLAGLAATSATAPALEGIAWPRYRAEVRARLAERRERSWSARWLRPLPVAASAAVAAVFAVVVYLAIPTPPAADLAAMEYEGLAARLPLIDQYRVVEQLDLLEDLDVIRNLEGLGGNREG
jgi:anti-sigma factor RsiW